MKASSLPVDGGFVECGCRAHPPGRSSLAAGSLAGLAVLLTLSLAACVSDASGSGDGSQTASTASAAPESDASSTASTAASAEAASEGSGSDATVAESPSSADLPRGTLPSGVSWIKPKGEIKPYPFDHCAVSRRKLRNKKFYRYYQGQEVILCCTACKKTFDADPDPFMPRIKEAVALAEAE